MITREETEKIAMLARLRLSQEEHFALSRDLQQMVGFVNTVSEVETGELTGDFTDCFDNVFRRDDVRVSFPREQILANAPLYDEEFFVVRKRA